MPRELMRRREAAYKENGFADDSLDDATLINGIVSNPVLMERPIVVNGRKAALGRPPEAVLEIL